MHTQTGQANRVRSTRPCKLLGFVHVFAHMRELHTHTRTDLLLLLHVSNSRSDDLTVEDLFVSLIDSDTISFRMREYANFIRLGLDSEPLSEPPQPSSEIKRATKQAARAIKRAAKRALKRAVPHRNDDRRDKRRNDDYDRRHDDRLESSRAGQFCRC